MAALRYHDTQYGNYVQQLGDMQVFRSASLMFDNIEEARHHALRYYRYEYSQYKRECSGKRNAAKAISCLQGTAEEG